MNGYIMSADPIDEQFRGFSGENQDPNRTPEDIVGPCFAPEVGGESGTPTFGRDGPACRDDRALFVGCEDYVDFADYDRLVRVSGPRLARPSMVLGERLGDGLVVARCQYSRHGEDTHAWVTLSADLARKLGVSERSAISVHVSPRPDETWRAETERLHLYLVEIVGVGVKVGITSNPKCRLAAHRKTAKDFGRSVRRLWLSAPHADAREFEQRLIGDSRSEYLRIPFEEAWRRLMALPDLGNGPLKEARP